MTLPPLPAGLVRSLALLCGVAVTVAAAWRTVMPLVATSDLASVATLVGGTGAIAWAAAYIASFARVTPAQAFATGLVLPAIALLPRRRPGAANDNHFSGSWPRFVSARFPQ